MLTSDCSLTVGDWQLDLLPGGMFSMDAGVVFGVVPKTVWQKLCPVDGDNLARFSCNCLLARNGRHTVLIDTGYGGKYPPLDRKSFRMEDVNPFHRSLETRGVSPDEVDHVLFTHLHFDHIGGATRCDEKRRFFPVFPRARHLVSNWELEDALSEKREMAAAYPRNELLPLCDAGLVDTFDRDGELLPGLTAIRTGGHTRGHTAYLFESSDASTGALFIGDLCPTRFHLRMSWNMAFDMFLFATRRKKTELLNRTVEKGWWLIFAHDPIIGASRLCEHPSKEFVLLDGP